MRNKEQKYAAKLKKAMESLSTVVTVPENHVLLEQGAYSREAILIVSGEAEVSRDGEYVATVRDGELIGETGLLSHTYTRNATVTTTTPCEIAVMSAPEFSTLLRNSAEFAALVDQTLVERDD